jgi:hypothetical protein
MVLVVKIFDFVQKVKAIFRNICSAKVFAIMNILVFIGNFSLNQNEPKDLQDANFAKFSFSNKQVRPFAHYRLFLIMPFI